MINYTLNNTDDKSKPNFIIYNEKKNNWFSNITLSNITLSNTNNNTNIECHTDKCLIVKMKKDRIKQENKIKQEEKISSEEARIIHMRRERIKKLQGDNCDLDNQNIDKKKSPFDNVFIKFNNLFKK